VARLERCGRWMELRGMHGNDGEFFGDECNDEE